MGTWNFSYDSLNRLVTAAVGSNAPAQYANNYGCWSYDDFGNRTAQSMSTTACANNPPLMSWAQYNGTVNGSGNNQMSASSQNANQASGYDAAGDLTNDGVNQYLYDGEGRICAVASTPVAGLTTLTGYIYDADGTRVAKGTLTQFTCDMNPADSAFNGFQPTNDYILGPSGEQAAEMGVGGSADGSASSGLVWLHSNIWAGGKLLGTYDGGTGIISADSTYGLHFYFDDPLGTRRVQTDYAGVVEQTCQSLPYGDGETCAPTPTENLFTGKERDAETNNDYFDARYYRSALGRFMTPDWSAKVEPVPYAKMGDPQSLNLYAYMMNNPLGGVDADGHNMDSDFVNFMSTISNDPGLMRNLGYTIGPQYDAIAHATAAPQVVSTTVQQQDDNSSTSSSTTGQDQSHYASVSYWPTGAGGFGHIGIGVDTDDTQGFSTKNPNLHWWQRLFGAPAARTEDDIAQHTTNGDVAPHSYLHIPVSAAQAQAMQASMADRKANPGHYNLLFNNCAGFVESVLHAGGVSGVPHAEIFGPPVLYGILAYDNSFR